MSAAIPVIDIADFDRGLEDRKRIAAEWNAAFSSAGFCSLIGYGGALITDEIYAAARAFFRLPLAEQQACPGYLPFKAESVGRAGGGDAAPDLTLAIQFDNLHRPGAAPPDGWPAHLTAFWDIAHRYAIAMGTLSQTLMRVSAAALDLEAHYFDRFYADMTTKLRCALYPDQIEPPHAGQFRNAPHTDFNGFTILRQDNAPGGLQVQMPDGAWIDISPVDGALVINAGDLIQRWTNDRWRSNVHRVINPPRSATGSSERLSIVLFTGPDPASEIACLPNCAAPDGAVNYPPIIAADHVREKVRRTLGYA